ncbi:MAG: hypothetical protein KKF89_00330 [Nanoarchaeota archaeon]|nr:hypothetical protein [Nanoarchaeota archaeon]MBU1854142.1 hypothetical protein [Nanoarchaeota archaeon]
MFKTYILDEKRCKQVYEKWTKIKNSMVEFITKTTAKKLYEMSSKELVNAMKLFHKFYDDFWAYGLIPEIANFGGESILKQAVEKNHPKNSIEILEVLSAPEELSFYQLEELELLKLKLESKTLDKHAKKYFWLENSYGRVKIADIKLFEERINEVSIEKAKRKIDEIKSFPERTKKKKEAAIKKYNISPKTQLIGSRLSFSIWWQDYRKQFIFMALHMTSLFAKELEKRYKVSFGDLLLYSKQDLIKLGEKGIKVEKIKERKEGFISYYIARKNSGKNYYGKEANAIAERYTTIKVDLNLKEIKGMVVSKGKVKGKVKILSGARHFDSFREGEILVTAMTSPEFVVAMRKAKAIVTDEGGMTCHAAIVARELGIPCIVGTKIATRALKDGDLVEVDANKGVVRKL